MATRTSVGSGLWSVAGTWDTGVPVNTDIVIVAAGHTVTFDVDQSGFANGVDLTITGTLQCSTSAGTYYLKCSADIDGAGNFNAGSVGTALPTNVTFTIDFNSAANSIEGAGGLTVSFYCTEPTNRYIKLSGAEAAGQTILSVDTDVTADIWAAGNTIRIDDVNGLDSEARVIAAGGIAASEITVTVALTNAKITGALVILVTRNIRVTGSTDYAFKEVDDSYIRCEVSGCTNGPYACDNSTFSGTFSGCTSSAYFCHNSTLSGIFSGCTKGADGCYNSTLSGTFSGCTTGAVLCHNSTLSGIFSGCTNGASQCHNSTLSGIFSGCTTGALSCYNSTLENALFGYLADGTLQQNTVADLRDCSGTGRSAICASTTQVTQLYTSATLGIENFGHVTVAGFPAGSNGDPGTMKSWSYAGTVERSTANPQAGTYHGRLTPGAGIAAGGRTIYLDASIYVPIASGQDISVSIQGSRSGMTSDCAKLVIDPEQAWFTSAQSTELLTNVATYYALTASASSARGTGAEGKVRIVLRVDEYVNTHYVDWDTCVITAGGIPYTVDFDNWENGMPTVKGPDYPAVADVEDGVVYADTQYTGTFAAPAAADVEDGVTYGGGGTQYTGTFTAPAVNVVLDGEFYGGGGTEYEGTLVQATAAEIWTYATRVLTAGTNLNDLSSAEVQAAADAALVANKLDHLVAVADSDDAVDNSLIAKLAATAGDWSTFVGSTDSLQAVRDEQVAIGTNVTWLVNVSEGDVKVEGTSPWTFKVYTKDTATVLITKYLYEKGGTAIALETQVVGLQLNTAT